MAGVEIGLAHAVYKEDDVCLVPRGVRGAAKVFRGKQQTSFIVITILFFICNKSALNVTLLHYSDVLIHIAHAKPGHRVVSDSQF